MADSKDERYSCSSSASRSNLGSSDGEDENAYSYFDAAAAAMDTNASSSTDSSISDDARPTRASTKASPGKHDLLDVPVEGKRVLATFGTNNEPYDVEPCVEETIAYDEQTPSTPRRGGTNRANQEYYDVLEMASSRLRQESAVNEIEMEGDISSGDDAVRKKKKKKKKKSKKEKRKKHSKKAPDEEEDADGARRSAVFKSLFPASMVERGVRKKSASTFSEKDLETGKNGSNDNMNNVDPNDDLPGRWNPAALVTVAQSKMSQSKTDENGFYSNMKGRADLAYGKVQTLVKGKPEPEEIPNDFNLQTIGKSSKKKRYKPLQRCDSIVWGDESVLSASPPTDHDVGLQISDRENEGIEMVDDCSYSDNINEAHQNYMMNEQLVQKLIWQRDRRRLGIGVLLVTIVFLSICLGLYFSKPGDGSQNSSGLPSTQQNDDEMDRNGPPPRPLPSVPTGPIDGFDSTSLHPITLTELTSIVNTITPDPSILGNPHTPQSKALEWCKNDTKMYNVEVRSRVVQRYALATLYYSTTGTGWTTNANWGNGHECEWYGVGCESGDDSVVSVTYLDLNSNNLDGSIPPEVGFISSLEQIHLWGNNLVGSIPNTLSKLNKLHTLYLDKNHLDGEMGDTFNQMKNLKHLDLSENRLRGHIPHGLGSLINLRDLRLANNFLTSTFPTSLISLSNLQTLLLDSNAISGTLPYLVGEMRSLVTIRIHENDLKGKIPSFTDAKVLEEAHFDGNYFSGPIPHFGSPHLRELFLGQNALTGSIPDNIGDLVNLEILSLKVNKLNSTIPSSLSNATALEILDLSHNKFSGEIPPGLSDLVQMREFRLDHNRLRGFPNWLGEMNRLEIVHLNNNLLAGQLNLPLDIGDLDDLQEFAIENNDLTGVLEEYMCDLLLDVLTSDCYGSPSRVDCPCCTECF